MAEQSNGELKTSPEHFTKHYKVLGEKTIVDGMPWSTEWLLSEYLQCTDRLIGKMDGTIPLDNVDVYMSSETGIRGEKRDLPPPASVIYLDKSARPVEWMVHKLWPILARKPQTPYSENNIPKEPKRYFLNIDKKDWLVRMGVPRKYLEDAPEELIDITKIDKKHLARIRALYSTVSIDEHNLDDAWNHPTIFDGQHVMIIDEVASSGQSLKIAQKLLAMAIPAQFSADNIGRNRHEYL